MNGPQDPTEFGEFLQEGLNRAAREHDFDIEITTDEGDAEATVVFTFDDGNVEWEVTATRRA